jgi:hypothetical protein
MLRTAGPALSSADAALVVQAQALAEWHRSHRFCPRCGGRLAVSGGGYVLTCESCERQQFPRTDPAVIMLVTDGERALLGRQAAWPPGRFSTLAGFVDPGESLEQAVAREVMEEAGIEVGDVSYFGNQPWPFPSSLMIGFFAPRRRPAPSCCPEASRSAGPSSRPGTAVRYPGRGDVRRSATPDGPRPVASPSPPTEGDPVLKKLIAAAALLVLTGCGVSEVDVDAVQDDIVSGVKDQLNEDVTVDCPDQVDWKTGGTFQCEVKDSDGNTRQAKVTMADDDGNVEWTLE